MLVLVHNPNWSKVSNPESKVYWTGLWGVLGWKLKAKSSVFTNEGVSQRPGGGTKMRSDGEAEALAPHVEWAICESGSSNILAVLSSIQASRGLKEASLVRRLPVFRCSWTRFCLSRLRNARIAVDLTNFFALASDSDPKFVWTGTNWNSVILTGLGGVRYRWLQFSARKAGQEIVQGISMSPSCRQHSQGYLKNSVSSANWGVILEINPIRRSPTSNLTFRGGA